MTQRPVYAVEAVDHTLAALSLLTQRDSVRLSELADELGIGRSTAHRLLQMLVYRSFAEQRPNRAYAAGPALMAARNRTRLQNLRSWLDPVLLLAYERLKESVQLQVVSGLDVISLQSIDPPLAGRRSVHGARLPAERASGGQVLLAHLPVSEVRARFARVSSVSLPQLEHVLAAARRQGYSCTAGVAGPDASSVSVPVFDHEDRAAAALTCTMPSARLTRTRIASVAAALADLATSAQQAHPEAGRGLSGQRRTG